MGSTSYDYLKDLALIIIFAKVFGLLARRINVPQVVGEIVAGLIIGPSILGLVNETPFISQMAEIGVILLMFMAGLETNLKELKQSGVTAFFVACCGVIFPLIGGTLLYGAFYGFGEIGSDHFLKCVFIGVIMTATSVSITVSALRELGYLKTRVGTVITSAAIIDDVIGIIVLTVVIGFKSPNVNPVKIIANTGLFFIFAIGIGIICYYILKKLDKKYRHMRRIPIIGLALCMAMAFIAEDLFGVADVTGAYIAGIILCNLHDSDYIAEKMDISSYMLFGPIFFASIGLKTQFDGITVTLLLFSLAFVAVALISKIIGCGLIAKLFKFTNADALKIGVGMMTRGEVALIVAKKGLDVKLDDGTTLLDSKYFTSVILLIIVSSVLTPIILKLLYKHDDKKNIAQPQASNN